MTTAEHCLPPPSHNDMANSKTVKFINGEEEFVDFTITCQHVEFRVHKVILSRSSEFFKTTLKGRNFKEAIDDKMDLSEEDPVLIEVMLDFVYKGAYQACEEDAPAEDAMLKYTKIYSLADRFDIPGMKEAAKTDFTKQLEGSYDQDTFAAIIAEVYSSTPELDRGLRDLVVKEVADDFEIYVVKPSFLAMMETNGFFGRDLVIALNRPRPSDVRSGIIGRFLCPVCGYQFERVINAANIHQVEECPHCNRSYQRSTWKNYLVD